ncbi:rhomboid-like protein [Streptomyces kronopolitis]|uniref:rhomboid-like protein n=1 Tax=Streptomyces kronopolitis TaxID=1612435 RepID=UPI003443FF28
MSVPARRLPRWGVLSRLRPVAVPRFAPLYVGAVQLGAYAAARLPDRRRTELLRAHSTNVVNLRAGRWWTPATSAVLVERPLPLPYAAALLTVLGTAEAHWGARRAAGVFAAGHAGASLLVYAGLRGRVCTDPPDATARAVDVGASYGFHATLGALAAAVPHRRTRAVAITGLLALRALPVLRRTRTFTDAGHLTATALGVLCGAGWGTGRILLSPAHRRPAHGGFASHRGPHRGQNTGRLVQWGHGQPQ